MTIPTWIVDLAQAWWLAAIAGDFGQLFGNALTRLVLSAALVIWAGWFGVTFSRGTRKLRQAFDTALATLSATPAEAGRFTIEYERIAAEFENWEVIGPAWRDWRATLITPAVGTMPVRATLRPAEYFSLDLLRNCNINPRLHSAMPNLLVGAGLLLTFFGLSFALAAAGGIVGAEKALRDAGLRALLDTASAKFVFSLVGLACSIGYTVLRSSRLLLAEQALDAFLVALEERIPLATAAGMQAEANALLHRSLEAQELFSNQLAVSIGSKLDEALDTRLGEHIGPLREAIERLSGSLGTRTEDAIQSMLEEFVKQLHGGSDDAMKEAAKTLTDLSASMGEVRAGLAEAATRMAGAADQMADQMGRQADEAMGRIALQMEGLVGQLRTLAEQSRDAGNDAMKHAADQIAAAGAGFTQSAQAVAASLEKAVADMTGRMGGEAEAATRLMTVELTRAIEALRTLAEASRNAGDDAVKQLVERLGQAAKAFEQSSVEVARAMAGGAGDAADRLTGAMEEMKGQFGRLADDLGGALRDASGTVAENSRSGAEALTQAANAAADALRIGGRDGGESLRSGGADAGRGLEAAAQTLTGPARDIAQRLTTLQAEAVALGAAVVAIREAATTVTAPLGRAAADLSKAGSSVQTATSDLTELGRGLKPMTDALTGAAARLEAVEKLVGDLSTRLTGAVQRFDGLDTALAGVFVNLRNGLDGFATQVDRFLEGTNDDMAKAANTLNAAVSGLAEALEDYRPVARRGA